jgi:uncharacterized protein YbcC (UPF0753/DUF2309 family)
VRTVGDMGALLASLPQFLSPDVPLHLHTLAIVLPYAIPIPRGELLEALMTAPLLVAHWINWQYYGSTVAPEAFGAGNKLLHNVVGGLGVVEGNGGVLRGGLPWQSVHDGERYVHEPLRLAVCIEAPCAAVGEILRRHGEVRALFDHGWLHLFALDEAGRMAWRYAGDLRWAALGEAAALPQGTSPTAAA